MRRAVEGSVYVRLGHRRLAGHPTCPQRRLLRHAVVGSCLDRGHCGGIHVERRCCEFSCFLDGRVRWYQDEDVEMEPARLNSKMRWEGRVFALKDLMGDAGCHA